MATSPNLSAEQQLHVQTAFLLTCAVDALDPILELKEKVELHNLAEYATYEAGPLRALLALSSNTIKFKANTKNPLQIHPTVFIAFSNSLRHPLHDVPNQTSMANFLAAQRQCGFPGATACRVHGHALAALESLPLGMVFSLLGQGFKLVATGYKFGGVVAHLFATRVLLQLHQEVQLARQMGINLSMTLADNKVSSYAFGSPFFATSSLSRTLNAMDLQLHKQFNLHTIWRAGDGSPAFFAAASELYTVASAARDATIDVTTLDVTADGAIPLEDVSSPASVARTPQVMAIQEWCRHVADAVDALPRCRASGPSRLLARPVETLLLGRLCAPGGIFACSPPALPIGSDPIGAGDAVAVAIVEKVQQVRIVESEPPTPKSSRVGSVSARPQLARRRSMETLDSAAGAAFGGRPLSPSRSFTARSKRAVSVTPEPTKLAAARTPAAASSSRQHLNQRASAWKEGLLRLLQVMGDGLGERYAPVGQFWILGSLPSEKDKTKETRGSPGTNMQGSVLQPVEGSRATQSSAAWLSPGNSAALFSRWESELEEIQRDLMEAFPWTTFRPSVEIYGKAIERRGLLRQSSSLDLSAL